MESDPKIVISLIGLLTILLVALVFGRIHQSKDGSNAIPTLGDRVIAGLLAMPLVSVIGKLIFTNAHIVVLMVIPLPVFIYTVFLTYQDVKDKENRVLNFTGGLFLCVLLSYAVIGLTIVLLMGT